jgi:DNA-binding IclR family transcriptional regulator
VPGLTGISAPVWGADGQLQGALTLTLPETRLKAGFAATVRQAAARLSQRLGALTTAD